MAQQIEYEEVPDAWGNPMRVAKRLTDEQVEEFRTELREKCKEAFESGDFKKLMRAKWDLIEFEYYMS